MGTGDGGGRRGRWASGRTKQRKTQAESLNVGEVLRLPVGLATTFDIQQLMQSKEFDDDVTPGHDSVFHRLKVTHAGKGPSLLLICVAHTTHMSSLHPP